MPINSRDDDLQDNDPTDELPILVETAVLDPALVAEAIRPAFAMHDDTGAQTARYPALAPQEYDRLDEELKSRNEKVEALEAEIRRLSARWLDLERQLAEKDGVIERLTASLATSKQALEDRAAAEQRLATEIADRESQFTQLLDELDKHRLDKAAREAELEEHRQRLASLEADLATTRKQLDEEIAKPRPPTDEERLHALQEEIAALTAYIANRRSRWDELESQVRSSAARIGELERELEHRSTRQRAAEQLAQNEVARAESLRRQLVETSLAVEERDRQIAVLRAAPPAPKADLDQLNTALAEATELNVRLQAELEAAVSRRASATAQPSPETAVSPASFEVFGQLEAELEHKRTQIGQLTEVLRSKERQLERIPDLEQVHRQLAEARAELEQSRAEVARLERSLSEKDRALDARNERLATLQQELDRKLEALQRLNAMEVSIQSVDSKGGGRLTPADTPPEQTNNTPALVCLTSDAPRQYLLSKATMTIGRSSNCDIQVFTHFVSREHARLIVDRSRVVIEDLGSTNGVFVNSVRVDRQELRHSDLVTVGETQFRFLESAAH